MSRFPMWRGTVSWASCASPQRCAGCSKKAAIPEQLKDFDLDAWVAQWMREPLPELGGKTPAEMLRNPERQRAIEQVLERMRGVLPA